MSRNRAKHSVWWGKRTIKIAAFNQEAHGAPLKGSRLLGEQEPPAFLSLTAKAMAVWSDESGLEPAINPNQAARLLAEPPGWSWVFLVHG